MDTVEILTIIVGYIYLFISIFINIIKVVYIFIKKKILPNLLLYYILKVVSGTAGILYGLTFLDKMPYYLVTPFLAVVSLDFIVLGIICVLNVKQYVNNLKKIYPEISNSAKQKFKNLKKPKRSILNKGKSMSDLRRNTKPSKPKLKRIKSETNIRELEETFMANYIQCILAEYKFGTKQKEICNSPMKQRKEVNKGKKKQMGKKKKTQKKKKKESVKDSINEYLIEEGENIWEEEEDYIEDLEDDEDIDVEEDDEEDDDEDDDDDDDDDEDDDGGGILDYIAGILEG